MSATIRRIGASRLATVSEQQTSGGQHVAIKEFNRQPLSPLQKTSIFEAAQRWKQLSGPGLVDYHEISVAEQWITMELFDRSAAIRLREGPSDPRLVLHTLRGVLAALVPLHTQELVHGNLKPSNVFFDTSGRTRLSDGYLLAPNSTADWPPPYNLKYMAPEQANADYGPISFASDVYCLGMLALELLAGDRFARAFPGMREDADEEDPTWRQWHGSSQIAPEARLFAPGCPESLATVVARMVAKQPQLRYANAQQVLQELPQDIAGRLAATTHSPASSTAQRSDFQAAHIIPRPDTGIVLAIASGSRAGEMIGSNENELMLGFDHDCLVRFSHDHYPAGGSKVLLRRGSQGWYALRVSGNTAFVNQRALEDKCPLRSGDILRLSPRGPDVQFTMQSGGVAIRALVERFLPGPMARPLGSTRDPGGNVSANTAAVSNGRATPPRAAASPAGGLSAAKVNPAETASDARPEGLFTPISYVAQKLMRQLRQYDLRSWTGSTRQIVLGLAGVLVVLLIVGVLLRLAIYGGPAVSEGPAAGTGPVGSSPAESSQARPQLESTAP